MRRLLPMTGSRPRPAALGEGFDEGAQPVPDRGVM